jgi:hypothetical protein
MLHAAPLSTSSNIAPLLDELALYGVKPLSDEADFRPLPELETVENAVATLVSTMTDMFRDTRLEDETEEMLWSLTNIFHRRLGAVQKRLDDNEARQRASLTEQDGSEVKSVELERLTNEGLSLTESRNAFEAMRDLAADHYRVETGSTWLPRTGSKVNHRALTASVIASRDFISAKRRLDAETHCPSGTRIAFTGGDYQDHDAIWDTLDRTLEKHPDMVLLHGGTPHGAELIASKWADARDVSQVRFQPNWKTHRKAAPFKRNDELLDQMPIGLIAAPGTGITENMVDKARRLGIPVLRFGQKVAA